MLHSVRSEPSLFNMAADHVEELDRAVNDLDNVLTTGLFQVPACWKWSARFFLVEDIVNWSLGNLQGRGWPQIPGPDRLKEFPC